MFPTFSYFCVSLFITKNTFETPSDWLTLKRSRQLNHPFFYFFNFLLFSLIINLSDVDFVWQSEFLDLIDIKKFCQCFSLISSLTKIYLIFIKNFKDLFTYMTRFLLPSLLGYNYFLQLIFNYWLNFKGKSCVIPINFFPTYSYMFFQWKTFQIRPQDLPILYSTTSYIVDGVT
jgi:hypothetical protein